MLYGAKFGKFMRVGRKYIELTLQDSSLLDVPRCTVNGKAELVFGRDVIGSSRVAKALKYWNQLISQVKSVRKPTEIAYGQP
jgi:hypothetical protein